VELELKGRRKTFNIKNGHIKKQAFVHPINILALP